MNYFVVGPDGQKYGPGDVVVLNQWAQQGRVTPTTVLEDSSTGARFAASQVPGMMFGPAQANMDPYQQYPRPGYGVVDNGDGDYQKALILGILSLVVPCFPLILASVGIYYASLAQRKGHPKANGVMTLCIVALILSFILGAACSMLMPSGSSSRGPTDLFNL